MLYWFAFLALLCLFGGHVAIGCTRGQRHRLCRKPSAKGKTPIKGGGKAASKKETRSQSASSKRYAPNKKNKRSAADLDNSFSSRLKKSFEIITNKSSKSDRLKKSARSPRSDRSGSKRSTRGSEKSVGSQKSEREVRGKSKEAGSRREE
uniref:Secreted protein n=1 Tax=Panagrellus redivivus TaxID=6233 RepID=A0A7E4UV51_PANRE